MPTDSPNATEPGMDGDRPGATGERPAAADDGAGPRVITVPRAGAGEEPRAETVTAPTIDSLLRCLLRVTIAFERPVSEADIRSTVPVPADGMTPQVFMRAADRIGYRVGRAAIDASTLSELPLPFVVVGNPGTPSRVALERAGDHLVMFDPVGGGSAKLAPDEVIAMGGEALLVRPKAVVSARADWRGLISSRVRRVLWELILASLIVNLFALISPLFIMTVYNKVIGQRALDTLDVLVIGMVVLYGFDFILRGIRGYISSHTGARVDALLGNEVVHHLLRLPYQHFETTPTGMITERLRQLDTIRAFFTGQMPVVLVDMVFVFVFVGALMVINPILGLVTVAAIPIFALISVAFHRTQRGLVERSFAALSAKTSALAETITNALTIKSLGLESEIERRWSSRLALSAHTGFESSNLANAVNVLGTILQQFISLVIIYLGARMIISGEMSIGALIAANILSSRAIAPIRQVVAAWNQLQEVRAAFARIDDIMETPAEPTPGEIGPVPRLRGDIALENLSFSFAEGLPPVLHGIDLEIESGSVLGIIGPSGSGKSTIAKLIQGLYQPTGGRVLIDQTDISHISPATLRSQIGVVPQEVQLFSGTVRENIAMGMVVKDPERVVAVAKFVGAHDFIQRLPQGYDTVLAERGGGLSAGQRQLLCIARALIRNPRILILDEATSALDAASEAVFIRNLKRASRGRTIVMVSHRMAPVSIADKVVLVIDGRVEREGAAQETIEFAMARMAEYSGAGGT